MAGALLECSFLIPIRRDGILSEGKEHSRELWFWLDQELFDRFEGGTHSPGLYKGFYRDADTGKRVDDASYKYTIAMEEDDVDRLRRFLTGLCIVFQQKCIYLSVAGRVEFIEARHAGR
jgi:hypothetical protein